MEHSYEQYQIERQDRIDRYVLGCMTEEERKEFEQDMAVDHELRKQTEFTERVRSAVVSREEKLAKMREWDKKKVTAAESSGIRKPIYWISSIAAVLVVGFFVVQMLKPGSAGDMGTSMSLPAYFEPEIYVRDGSDYADIKEKIRNREFARAFEQITNAESELTNDSLDISGNPGLSDDERKGMIERVVRKRAGLNWLKAWALLGLDRKDDAMQLIDSFRSQDVDYTAVADSLYNLISAQ